MTLIVTLLTGRRPHLLDRTLASVEAHHGLLADAYWLVCHNGGDEATWTVLHRHADLINRVVETPKFLTVGPAASFLFSHVSDTEHLFALHLEDDWEAEAGDWLVQAGNLLLDGVFQVRLRHHDEPVLGRHQVTRRRIHWTEGDGYQLSPDAHYTLNPSLMLVDDLRRGWPAVSERDAQQRFWAANRRSVAQLVPGIWRHIGGGQESLRLRR